MQPRSQVEDSELFETESGFKEALAGVYSSMVSSKTYAKELTFGFVGVLGREWDYFSQSQYEDADIYNYEATYPTNYISGIWANNYSGITNANNLLAHIDDHRNVFSPDNYNVIKGEALALRAFLHFDLLRCFGVSYAVNPDQPSIPYCTALSYRVFPQLTVRQVAEKVLEDLAAAEALLKDSDPIKTGREITESVDNGYLLNRQMHLNYYAVKALQARVLMWTGEYDEALEAADEVIESGKFPWATVANLQAGSDRCLRHRAPLRPQQPDADRPTSLTSSSPTAHNTALPSPATACSTTSKTPRKTTATPSSSSPVRPHTPTTATS